MTKGELAKKYFEQGNNCSMAVTLAFIEEIGIEEEKLKKLIIGFGGGIARQRLTCGAVSGMTAVLGAVLSDGKDRASIYPIVKEGCDMFISELGALSCEELLSGVVKKDGSPIPEARTAEYYKKRPCADICQITADITQKLIEKYNV